MRGLWVILLAFLAGMALATSLKAEERNPLYRQSIPGTNVPCCDKHDCRAIEKYRMVEGGHYEIWLEPGYWYRPDPKVIRKQHIPDGKAHACYTEKLTEAYGPRRIMVYCVWIPILFM